MKIKAREDRTAMEKELYDGEKNAPGRAEALAELQLPRYGQLPAIDLYLDQVISILNGTLKPFFDQGEDKIITGAMVNNYVKHKVIQAPKKKRYQRTHLSCLFMICILKKIFSIGEIAEMMKMDAKEAEISAAYDQFCQELENALALRFSQGPLKQETDEGKQEEEREQDRLVWSCAALALANKLYVQKLLHDRQQKEKNAMLLPPLEER